MCTSALHPFIQCHFVCVCGQIWQQALSATERHQNADLPIIKAYSKQNADSNRNLIVNRSPIANRALIASRTLPANRTQIANRALTAVCACAGAQVAPVREQGIQYMQQAPWTISAAPAGSQAAVAALGAVNILGVAFLTNLATVNAFALAADPSLAWIPSILPFLQAYAAVFVAAPLVRWGLNALKNARLAITNSSRVVAAQVRLFSIPPCTSRCSLSLSLSHIVVLPAHLPTA